MRVLIGCARSGVVGNAFRARGHIAMECDIEPTRGDPRYHIQDDIFNVVIGPPFWWDLFIVHPPCTYLSVSGLHWNKRRPERAKLTEEAWTFVKRLWDLNHPRFCLENPISAISTRLRKPDQIIQPYQFGEDASKATCLWLRGLPKLVPTNRISGRMVNGRERWSNQTDSGQNRLGPSESRAEMRSKTYQGIAEAMANQWS
jgi:hypothetical protein